MVTHRDAPALRWIPLRLVLDVADSRLVTTTPDADPHAESSVPVILWLIPLPAVVVTPGLMWAVSNRPFAFRFYLFVTMSVVAGVVATAIVAVLSRGFRHRIRWSLGVTTVTMIAVFEWPYLTRTGRVLAQRFSLPILADVVPVAIAVGLVWVGVRLAHDWPFVALVAPIVLVTAGVLAVNSASFAAPTPAPLPAAEAAPGSPDVLLLVLDGYGRDDVLREDYGFDMSGFLGGLEARGFGVATEATTNYSFTYASIASMLEMDYVFDLGEMADSEFEVMRNALSGGTGMMERFKQAGYDVAYLENPWGGSSCGERVDWCIRNGLVERSMWNLGQMTVFAPVLKAVRSHPFNTVSLSHLESLPEILGHPRSDGRPRFTFAHIILPHPPFLLDASCGNHNSALRRAISTTDEELLARRRQFYADQAACTNDGTLRAVDGLIAANPGAVVMITGDHGPAPMSLSFTPSGKWSDRMVAGRMRILSAYRLPGCDEMFRADLTPVNGTRAVTNCALGTNLPELPDHNYWSPSNGEGPVVDVTDRVGR